MNGTFDIIALQAQLRRIEEYKYRITVVINKKINDYSYILLLDKKHDYEILLSKTLNNRRQFNKEIKTLSKVFNAEIITEL